MIELDGISKSFPGVKSLDAVNFNATSGEIHALLGENGAGKSTLIKVIAGAYLPEAGVIRLEGQERAWQSPRAAKDAGIHVIYQELNLFPEMTVGENIFISDMPRTRLGLVDRRRMTEAAEAILDRLGHPLDPNIKVKSLSIADRQMVEIAKAMTGPIKLLILDEPTAVLTGRETDLLFQRMKTLRKDGVCLIYISHRLEEIFKIADRVTVMKDGRYVATRAIKDVDRDSLVTMMVGRKLTDVFPAKSKRPQTAQCVLSVRNLAAAPKVKDVNFDLYAGEVLGLAGLVGAGRSEAAHAIFGSINRNSGTVSLLGQEQPHPSPRKSIDRGLGYLTEDRKGEGLHLELDVAANITAPKLKDFSRSGALDRTAEITAAAEDIGRLSIAVPGPKTGVKTLSGGNQQKVLFARWTRACQRVLILDEPTRGVDVGAKAEIYAIIRRLASEGLGILLISSELQEIVGLCTRVLVMREGIITGSVEGEAITEAAIMRLATEDRTGPTTGIAA